MNQRNTKQRTQMPEMKTSRMGFRASSKDREIIAQKAQQCGISQSEYIRLCATGHKPDCRLTSREAEAYLSLANARADLIHIKNALNGTPQSVRLALFQNERFMQRWIAAVDEIVRKWYDIEQNLSRGL